MLDPWIIEQIRRREEEQQRRRQERPVAERPPEYRNPPRDRSYDEEDRDPTEKDRGVTIIDFGV